MWTRNTEKLLLKHSHFAVTQFTSLMPLEEMRILKDQKEEPPKTPNPK